MPLQVRREYDTSGKTYLVGDSETVLCAVIFFTHFEDPRKSTRQLRPSHSSWGSDSVRGELFQGLPGAGDSRGDPTGEEK